MTSESPDMRASDAERERVAETLREAVAEGRLEMDEFEQRLDATFKARTHGELVPLVRDLPVPGTTVAPVGGLSSVAAHGSSASTSVDWSRRIGGPATSTGAFAFWSGFGRKGRWTVGRVFTAVAVWGGGDIDLREANFEDREVVIRCFAVMGGIDVKVPPNVDVHVNGVGFMGGFDEQTKDAGEPEPGAPRVRVTGFALMGGVGVTRKWTKAQRQRRREAEGNRLRKPDTGDGRKELG